MGPLSAAAGESGLMVDVRGQGGLLWYVAQILDSNELPRVPGAPRLGDVPGGIYGVASGR
jgi:hypothetical protein